MAPYKHKAEVHVAFATGGKRYITDFGRRLLTVA
jgi:hypothetical protein